MDERILLNQLWTLPCLKVGNDFSDMKLCSCDELSTEALKILKTSGIVTVLNVQGINNCGHV